MCVGARNLKKTFPGRVLCSMPGNPGKAVLPMAESHGFSRFRTVCIAEVWERLGFSLTCPQHSVCSNLKAACTRQNTADCCLNFIKSS